MSAKNLVCSTKTLDLLPSLPSPVYLQIHPTEITIHQSSMASELPAWEPVRDQLFAVATHQFEPKTSQTDKDFPDQVQLAVGDVIEIHETCGTWHRGYVFVPVNVHEEPKFGVVPANHTHVVPSLAITSHAKFTPKDVKSAPDSAIGSEPSPANADAEPDDSEELPQCLRNSFKAKPSKGQPPPDCTFPAYQSEVSDGEPLVDDIHSALRDWNLELKRLLMEQNYKQYALLKKELYYVVKGRRQLIGRSVSEDGMEKVRSDLVSRINRGNYLQNLDLILLDPLKGACVDIESKTNVIQMFRDYTTLSDSVAKTTTSKSDYSSPRSPTLHRLGFEEVAPETPGGRSSVAAVAVLELKNLSGPITTHDNWLELRFSICSKAGPKFLTEALVVSLPPCFKFHDLPKQKAMFADLTNSILTSETFLVVQVLEVGPVGDWGMRKSFADQATVRKPFAVGCLDTQDLLQGKETQPTQGFAIRLAYSSGSSNFATMHESMLTKVQTDSKDIVYVGLRAYPYDVTDYIMTNPLYKTSPIVMRNSYPTFIPKSDARNSLFVTVGSGIFSKQSGRNVQVTLVVRTKDEQPISSCLFAGGGTQGESRLSSFVHYHCSNPVWNDTVRIDLEPTAMMGAHVLFIFRHCSSSDKVNKGDRLPFGFAFLSIANGWGQLVEDMEHKLVVYKADKAGIPKGYLKFQQDATCLKVDSSVNNLEDLVTASDGSKMIALKDSFSCSTSLCSSALTQNRPLVRLLNWRGLLDLPYNDITSILRDLQFVGEVEMLKFLPQAVDALFGILKSKLNPDSKLNDVILAEVVRFMQLERDRRLTSAGRRIRTYIDEQFNFASVWPDLVVFIKGVLAQPPSPQILQYRKSVIQLWGTFFALALRSRKLQQELEKKQDGQVSETVNTSFKQALWMVLKEISEFMGVPGPEVARDQMVALQSFSSVLDQLETAFNGPEVVEVLVSFADAIGEPSHSSVLEHKLLFILNTVKGKLFLNQEARVPLAKACCRWLREHTSFWNPSSGGAGSRKNVLRYCMIILAEIIDRQQQFIRSRIKAGDEMSEDEQEMERVCCELVPVALEQFHDAMEIGDEMKQSVISAPSLNQLKSFSHTMSSLQFSTTPSVTTSIISPSSPQPSTFSSGVGSNASNSGPTSPQEIHGRPTWNPLAALTGTCVLGLLNMVSPERLAQFIKESRVENSDSTRVLVIQLFEVSKCILEGESYPQSWVNLHIFSCKVFVQLFEVLFDYCTEAYSPKTVKNFDHWVWCSYFKVLASLILAFGRHAYGHCGQTKRLASIVAPENQIFTRSMLIFARAWNICGKGPDETPMIECQRRMIPELIGEVMNLALFRNSTVRESACTILFQMIRTEHQLKKSISRLEQDSITKLDTLLAVREVTEKQRSMFPNEFMAVVDRECKNDDLRRACMKYGNLLAEFLKLTWTVVTLAGEDQYEDDRWEATMALAKFMRRNGREVTYLKYISNLADSQMKNNNPAEAGYTLKKHADSLTWDNDVLLEANLECGFDKRQTSFERKEELYNRVITWFDQGKQWEAAIDMCEEVGEQYRKKLFRYDKLASVLRRQADFHERIGSEKRYYSEYFRVGFYGLGFPSSLRNRLFIYRGMEWEKIGPFCERIQAQHPEAELLKTNTPPNNEVMQSNRQYLQITRVEPEPDMSHPVLQEDPDTLNENIRQFYQFNNVSTFAFSRPIKKMQKNKENEFLSLWTEMTLYHTEDTFPHHLRRSPVVRTEIKELSPIQNAVSTMRKKTSELTGLEKRFAKSPKDNCNPLTMSLNGAIDAPVNGGINMYKSSFLSPGYLEANSEHADLVKDLRRAIDDQVVVMRRCLELHQHIVPPTMRPLHDKLVELFFINYEEEVSRLHLPPSIASSGQDPTATEGVPVVRAGGSPRSSVSGSSGSLSNSMSSRFSRVLTKSWTPGQKLGFQFSPNEADEQQVSGTSNHGHTRQLSLGWNRTKR